MVQRKNLLCAAVFSGVLMSIPACEYVQPIVSVLQTGSQSDEESKKKAYQSLRFSNSILRATGNKDSAKWASAIAAGVYVADKIVTQEVERRRAEYDRESEYLDSEIETAENSLNEREKTLAETNKKLAAMEGRISALEKQAAQNALDKQQAEEARKAIEQILVDTQTELEIAEAELAIYTEAVNTSKTKTDDSVSEADLEKRRAELTKKRDLRLKQYNQMLSAKKRAELLKERIDAVK